MLPITCTSPEESAACPIRSVLSRVMGKWQMIIILSLEDGALRFAEVRRAIGDVTQRVLTENLRGLEKDGYLTRTVMSGPPLAVTYELTERGHDLVRVVKPMVFWARDNMEDVKRSRTAFEVENPS
ncbi:MAG: helix-turn-helix domain-containing protein [Pseudomonadota bacterium]